MLLELTALEPSPGIRTYQATLLGLLVLAARLGARRGRGGHGGLLEFAPLADQIEATVHGVRGRCLAVAHAIAPAQVLTFLGSGPALGTAMFSAAKMIEATGIASLVPDLGEWWHVERRARPADMPVFVIAPPGRSLERAVRVTMAASRLGRRVIAVADSRDTDITEYAHAVLPVRGSLPEEFSPLLYHVFAGYLASFTAQELGRAPFDSDQAGIPRTL